MPARGNSLERIAVGAFERCHEHRGSRRNGVGLFKREVDVLKVRLAIRVCVNAKDHEVRLQPAPTTTESSSLVNRLVSLNGTVWCASVPSHSGDYQSDISSHGHGEQLVDLHGELPSAVTQERVAVQKCLDGLRVAGLHDRVSVELRVSGPAAAYGRAHDIAVIDGGCLCMFGSTADFAHKAMRVVFTLSGNVPRPV